MSTAMDKQNRRAGRILRQFGHYVDEAEAERRRAEAERARFEIPAIARAKPHAWARLRQKVARRLFEKGKVTR